MRRLLVLTGIILVLSPARIRAEATGMEFIRVGPEGDGFVFGESGKQFRPWGVNYDHDADGRLIEDYWDKEWATVEEDFGEMKALGANVVRVHLQTGKFMASADEPSPGALGRLADLLDLAEKTGLYLDLTGLGCYHKADVPAWFDALDEAGRWKSQARFWSAVAGVCADSPAVFCYDLMNEPILPGKEPESDWLGGEFGGKYFVQRISLELKERTREEVARAWIETMVGAIREKDTRHLVTVGVIPWALVFPKAKPLFHDPETGKMLDFVSVHFYPEAGKVDQALEALAVYQVGKPVVVEECFPLKCSFEELEDFIARATERGLADGWMSFYWGRPAEEYGGEGETLSGAITGEWLRRFKGLAPRMKAMDAAR